MNQQISCAELLSSDDYQLGLKLVAGEGGLANTIKYYRIQKPGLAMAGQVDQIQSNRVQVVGSAEIEFLMKMPPDERGMVVQKLFSIGIACIVISRGLGVPPEFVEFAEKTSTPLFSSPHRTSVVIERLERLLVEKLVQRTHLHGVMVDVMGVGILFRGPSGVGKSECAMDLILRGHRLVADDVVEISRNPPLKLVGRGTGIIRYNMEIRGLGILNIQDLFGITAVRPEKKLDLVIDLVPWEEGLEYDRLGLDEKKFTILDVEITYLRILMAPGRNISSVIEVAARNHLLKMMGHNSAKKLADDLLKRLTGSEV